jgi:hypothetical protein
MNTIQKYLMFLLAIPSFIIAMDTYDSVAQIMHQPPSFQSLERKYPIVFADIPEKYYSRIVNFVEKNAHDRVLESIQDVRQLVWHALAHCFDCFVYRQFGYVNICSTRFKGQAEHKSDLSSYTINDYIQEGPDVLEKLVQEYKIHLMPRGQMVAFLAHLMEIIHGNRELLQLIYMFKLRLTFDDNMIASESKRKPKIVIYPEKGKESAQQMLNRLYVFLKDLPGLDVSPRYNCKVTSLIYVAQGNGDDKNFVKEHPEYIQLYEQPEMVYFNAETIAQITGKQQPDYHLEITQ